MIDFGQSRDVVRRRKFEEIAGGPVEEEWGHASKDAIAVDKDLDGTEVVFETVDMIAGELLEAEFGRGEEAEGDVAVAGRIAAVGEGGGGRACLAHLLSIEGFGGGILLLNGDRGDVVAVAEHDTIFRHLVHSLLLGEFGFGIEEIDGVNDEEDVLVGVTGDIMVEALHLMDISGIVFDRDGAGDDLTVSLAIVFDLFPYAGGIGLGGEIDVVVEEIDDVYEVGPVDIIEHLLWEHLVVFGRFKILGRETEFEIRHFIEQPRDETEGDAITCLLEGAPEDLDVDADIVAGTEAVI